MPDVVTVEPVRDAMAVQEVVRLAREIWNEHYPPIIGQAQVDYMLDRFQSESAINEQIRAGDEYFVLRLAGQSAGYLAIDAYTSGERLFVSKLYVLATLRGRSVARQTLDWLANAYPQPVLWLKVNKHNPAVAAYCRLGFDIVEAMVTDIGEGYIMDDYMLECRRHPGS